MPTDRERELLRAARLHRHQRGRWADFWQEHRNEIRAAFPDPKQRMDLVHRLQSTILLGIGPEAVEEIPS